MYNPFCLKLVKKPQSNFPCKNLLKYNEMNSFTLCKSTQTDAYTTIHKYENKLHL